MNNSLSRGALEMTFQILKSQHPELALSVRNILNGCRDNSEIFSITLSQEQISGIADALEKDITSISDPGMQMVAQALLNDWRSFEVEWIDLPAEQIDPPGDEMMSTACGIPIAEGDDNGDWEEH